MEIKFVFRGGVYSICIGRKTPWFCQLSFVSITREYVGKGYQVEYAECLWRFPKCQ